MNGLALRRGIKSPLLIQTNNNVEKRIEKRTTDKFKEYIEGIPMELPTKKLQSIQAQCRKLAELEEEQENAMSISKPEFLFCLQQLNVGPEPRSLICRGAGRPKGEVRGEYDDINTQYVTRAF